VFLEELICRQVTTCAVLLGKHVAQVALMHLSVLVTLLGHLLLGLVYVLLLASEEPISDLLHSRSQRLLLLLRSHRALIHGASLCRLWLLVQEQASF